MRSPAARPGGSATSSSSDGTARPGTARPGGARRAPATPLPEATPTPGGTPVSGPVRLLGPVVRAVSPVIHHRHIERLSGAYLQAPQSARAVPCQVSENLGWFNGKGRLIGSALVLYRRSANRPGTEARVPGGPILPWNHVAADPRAWLGGLQDHTHRAGARLLSVSPEVPLRMCPAEAFLAGTSDLDPTSSTTAAHLAGNALTASLKRAGWNVVEDPRPLIQRIRALIPLSPSTSANAVPALGRADELVGGAETGLEVVRLHRSQLDVVSDLYADVLGVVPMAQYWSRSRLNRLWDAFTPPSPQSDPTGDSAAETGHDSSWERTRPIAYGVTTSDGRLMGAVITVQLGGRLNLVRAVCAEQGEAAVRVMEQLLAALMVEGRRLEATSLDLGPGDVFVGLDLRDSLSLTAGYFGALYEPIGRWTTPLR